MRNLILIAFSLLIFSCSNEYDYWESNYAFFNPNTPNTLYISDFQSFSDATKIANGEDLTISFNKLESNIIISIKSKMPIDMVHFNGYIAGSYDEEQRWNYYYNSSKNIYEAELELPEDRVYESGSYNGHYVFQISRKK